MEEILTLVCAFNDFVAYSFDVGLMAETENMILLLRLGADFAFHADTTQLYSLQWVRTNMLSLLCLPISTLITRPTIPRTT